MILEHSKIFQTLQLVQRGSCCSICFLKDVLPLMTKQFIILSDSLLMTLMELSSMYSLLMRDLSTGNYLEKSIT
jgi:hypothetical protein